MWSFDARDIDRALERQASGRTNGTGMHSQELPLVNSRQSVNVPHEELEEEWVERMDPNGVKYFENTRTRRATWTDRRGINPGEHSEAGSVSVGSRGSSSRRGSAGVNQSRRGR